MLFSSPVFLFLFLPMVLLLYFTIGRKFSNLILIIASLIFYFWGEPSFIYILLIIIFINYFFGLLIQKYLKKTIAKKILFLSIMLNLGSLIYYKYFVFLIQNFNNFFTFLIQKFTTVSGYYFSFSVPKIVLPLAISFFTFHAISYNVDIFRKKSKAQKNPFQLLLYFLFFPHLLAGPIVRYHTIVDQLTNRIIGLDGFTSGIQRFILGLAKKVLIADKLSPIANEIFSIPTDHLGTSVAWVGIICFTLQIYFDFSGYSDMAIGLAKMFGFTFPENFNYPYISISITEFWRRWHITLSSWFRDYVYIPLGGNRVGVLKRYFNLWTVFILVGIWHGASWNFVVWGIIQAFFLSLERFNNGFLFKSLWHPFKHIYTLIVIIIGWVFFRAESLTNAFAYLQVLLGLKNEGIIFQSVSYFLQLDIIVIIFIGIISSVPSFYYLKRIGSNFEMGFKIAKLIGFALILFLISATVASQTYNPFLYFRF